MQGAAAGNCMLPQAAVLRGQNTAATAQAGLMRRQCDKRTRSSINQCLSRHLLYSIHAILPHAKIKI